MSGLFGDIIEFAVLWAFTYAALFALYAAWVVLVVEPVSTWWERRQAAKRLKGETARELARIDADAEASVQRIQAAYCHAQRLLHDEAMREAQR